MPRKLKQMTETELNHLTCLVGDLFPLSHEAYELMKKFVVKKISKDEDVFVIGAKVDKRLRNIHKLISIYIAGDYTNFVTLRRRKYDKKKGSNKK